MAQAEDRALTEFYGTGLNAKRFSSLPLSRYSLQLQALLTAHQKEGSIFALQLAAKSAADYGSDSNIFLRDFLRTWDLGTADRILKAKPLNLANSGTDWRFLNSIAIPVLSKAAKVLTLNTASATYVDPRKYLFKNMLLIARGNIAAAGVYRVDTFDQFTITLVETPGGAANDITDVIPINLATYNVLSLDVLETGPPPYGEIFVDLKTILDLSAVPTPVTYLTQLFDKIELHARRVRLFNTERSDAYYRIRDMDSATGVIETSTPLTGVDIAFASQLARAVIEYGSIVAAIVKNAADVSEIYMAPFTTGATDFEPMMVQDGSDGVSEFRLLDIKKFTDDLYSHITVRQFNSTTHEFVGAVTSVTVLDGTTRRGWVVTGVDLTTSIAVGDVIYINGGNNTGFYKVAAITAVRIDFTTSMLGSSGAVVRDVLLPPKITMQESIYEEVIQTELGILIEITGVSFFVGGDIRDNVALGDWLKIEGTPNGQDDKRLYVIFISYSSTTNRTELKFQEIDGTGKLANYTGTISSNLIAKIFRDPTNFVDGWYHYHASNFSYEATNTEVNDAGDTVPAPRIKIVASSQAEAAQIVLNVNPQFWMDVEQSPSENEDDVYQVVKTEVSTSTAYIYVGSLTADAATTSGLIRLHRDYVRIKQVKMTADVVYPSNMISPVNATRVNVAAQKFRYENRNDNVLRQTQPLGMDASLMWYDNTITDIERGISGQRLWNVRVITELPVFGFDMTAVVTTVVHDFGATGRGRITFIGSVDPRKYFQAGVAGPLAEGATVVLSNGLASDGTYEVYEVGATYVEMTKEISGPDTTFVTGEEKNVVVKRKIYTFTTYFEDVVTEIDVANPTNGTIKVSGDITASLAANDFVYLLDASNVATTLDGEYYRGIYKVSGSPTFAAGTTTINVTTPIYGVDKAPGVFRASLGKVTLDAANAPIELVLSSQLLVVINSSLTRNFILKQDMRLQNTDVSENSELIRVSEMHSTIKVRDSILSETLLENGEDDFNSDDQPANAHFVGQLVDHHPMIIGEAGTLPFPTNFFTNFDSDFSVGQKVGLLIQGLPSAKYPEGAYSIQGLDEASLVYPSYTPFATSAVRKLQIDDSNLPNFVPPPSVSIQLKDNLVIALTGTEATSNLLLDLSNAAFSLSFTDLVTKVEVSGTDEITLEVAQDLRGQIGIYDLLTLPSESTFSGNYLILEVTGNTIKIKSVSSLPAGTESGVTYDITIQRELRSVLTTFYLEGLLTTIDVDNGSGKAEITVGGVDLTSDINAGDLVVIETLLTTSNKNVFRYVDSGANNVQLVGSDTKIRLNTTLPGIDESGKTYSLRIMDQRVSVLDGFHKEDGAYKILGIIPRTVDADKDKMMLAKTFYGVRNSSGTLQYSYKVYKLTYFFINGTRAPLGHLVPQKANFEPEMGYVDIEEKFASDVEAVTIEDETIDAAARVDGVSTILPANLLNITKEMKTGVSTSVFQFFGDKVYIGSREFFNAVSINLEVLAETAKKTITVVGYDISVAEPDIRISVNRDPTADFAVNDFVSLIGIALSGQYKVTARATGTTFSEVVTDVDVEDSVTGRGKLSLNTNLTASISAGDLVYVEGSDNTGAYKVFSITASEIQFTTRMRGTDSSGLIDANRLDVNFPVDYIDVRLGSNEHTYNGGLVKTIAATNKIIMRGDYTTLVASDKAGTYGGQLKVEISGSASIDGEYTLTDATYDNARDETEFSSSGVSADLTDVELDITPYRQILPAIVDEVEANDGFGNGVIWVKGAGNIVVASLQEIITATGSISVAGYASGVLFPVLRVEFYPKSGTDFLRIVIDGELPSNAGPALGSNATYYFMKDLGGVVGQLKHTGTVTSGLILKYFDTTTNKMEEVPTAISVDEGTGGATRDGVILADLSSLNWGTSAGAPDLIRSGIVTNVDVDNGGSPARGEITVNEDLTGVLSAGDFVHLFDDPNPLFKTGTEGDYEIFSITPTLITTVTVIRGADYVVPPRPVTDLTITRAGFYIALERRVATLFQPPTFKTIDLLSSTRISEDTDGLVTGVIGTKYVVTRSFPATLENVHNTGPVGLQGAFLVENTSIINLNTKMSASLLGLVTIRYTSLNTPYLFAKTYTDFTKIERIESRGQPNRGASYESAVSKLRGFDFFVENFGLSIIPIQLIANISGKGRIQLAENVPDSVKVGDTLLLWIIPDDGKSGIYTVDSVSGKIILLTTPMSGSNVSNPNAEIQVFSFDRLSNKYRSEWREVIADIIQSINSVHSSGRLFVEEPSPNENKLEFPTEGERNSSINREAYRFYRRF